MPVQLNTPARPSAPPASVPLPIDDAALRRSAEELAASFLTEMLKETALAESFGGDNEMSQTFAHEVLSQIGEELSKVSPLAEEFYDSLKSRSGQ